MHLQLTQRQLNHVSLFFFFFSGQTCCLFIQEIGKLPDIRQTRQSPNKNKRTPIPHPFIGFHQTMTHFVYQMKETNTTSLKYLIDFIKRKEKQIRIQKIMQILRINQANPQKQKQFRNKKRIENLKINKFSIKTTNIISQLNYNPNFFIIIIIICHH